MYEEDLTTYQILPPQVISNIDYNAEWCDQVTLCSAEQGLHVFRLMGHHLTAGPLPHN